MPKKKSDDETPKTKKSAGEKQEKSGRSQSTEKSTVELKEESQRLTEEQPDDVNDDERESAQDAHVLDKTQEKDDTPEEEDAEPRYTRDGERFPIVGVGASAGGLEAFEHFLNNVRADSGMAYVLVQHLDPTHRSILSDLLGGYTELPVVQVSDGVKIEPNKVYVIPPNRYMAIENRILKLYEMENRSGLRTPIDFFFKSLAQDQEENAICVVLSGTGTEGAMGLRAVKGAGGLAVVQDPETAKYDGMPRSALQTGLVDFILPPDRIPEQIEEYVKHATALPRRRKREEPKQDAELNKIFLAVKSHTGHDFSAYKKNTVLRRIDRRMAVHRMSKLSDYADLLKENAEEAQTLFKELLIGVTSFFRDREAFEVLRDEAIAEILADRDPDDPVRVWVAGVSTGEEAYSVALVLYDQIRKRNPEITAQVFATDLDNDGVDYARHGMYPEGIKTDIPSEYLEKYFIKENHQYRINREIRDLIVFASHNIINDPPFSRIDLLCCRNLLIYLDTDLQKHILPIFHYAIKPGGFLFLGSSESVGSYSDHFATVNRKWKLFRRKDTEMERHIPLDIKPRHRDQAGEEGREEGPHKPSAAPAVRHPIREAAERLLLDNFSPPAVIIKPNHEVVFVHGRTGKYLELPRGEFSGNLLSMAREGLEPELGSAVKKAARENEEVRRDGIFITTNGGLQEINLIVRPISKPRSLEGKLLIVFEDVVRPNNPEKYGEGSERGDRGRAARLERELASTKEYLRTTTEELETSNEELTSANEELQSSNEELQSTNEELETSKEELQSVNEELTTVNVELQQKIDELSKTTSDLNNLLAGTDIGMVFLDKDMKIQRFTPSVTEFLNLIETDVGRPVSHIVSNLNYDDLVDDAKEVLNTLESRDAEVQTHNGTWFLMRIVPYRTPENVIDGVVITFVEITKQKHFQQELKTMSNVFMEAIDPMIIEAVDGTVRYVNREVDEVYGWTSQHLVGKSVFETIPEDERENVEKHREKALAGKKIRNIKSARITRQGDRRDVYMSFFLLTYENGDPEGVATVDKVPAHVSEQGGKDIEDSGD